MISLSKTTVDSLWNSFMIIDCSVIMVIKYFSQFSLEGTRNVSNLSYIFFHIWILDLSFLVSFTDNLPSFHSILLYEKCLYIKIYAVFYIFLLLMVY